MNFLQTGYKGKNESWMYVIMFFIVFFGSMLGQIPITIKAFFCFRKRHAKMGGKWSEIICRFRN